MIVNGTTYSDKTDPDVVELLEAARVGGWRLRIYYGNRETGKADEGLRMGHRGRVSRSTGEVKVPILIVTVRSAGGQPISTNSIVRIEASPGGALLYTHPTFHH